ncbi:hypothetical protein ABZ504_46650, partial [Streptomyces mirabilis]|uniref:hypothetical protein n=1 Tax=Streptomyces mirabilis TaxID=68239 RepID=UPI00340F0850
MERSTISHSRRTWSTTAVGVVAGSWVRIGVGRRRRPRRVRGLVSVGRVGAGVPDHYWNGGVGGPAMPKMN